jgi:uncharacterized protein YehS (DUF1456 family)
MTGNPASGVEGRTVLQFDDRRMTAARAVQYGSRRSLPAVWKTMINNDVLRSLRFALDNEAGAEPCSDEALAHVLDGLIVHLRGRDESQPQRAIETRIDNNLILKKLRVAFQLRDVDLQEIFQAAGFAVSKPELSAVFRQRDHKHFRKAGDQLMRYFLKGLVLRVRGSSSNG